MESLTPRILRFQQTGQGREAVLRDVARRVYEYPRRKCRWDEETSSEFFAAVFPRVGGMVDRFKDLGRPFESYLATMLGFQVRSFAREKRRRDLEWAVAADPDFWECDSITPAAQEEAETAQAAPFRGAGAEGEGVQAGLLRDERGRSPWESLNPKLRELFEMGEDGRIRSESGRRRFLMVCLRSAHLMSDSDVASIARIVDWGEEALHQAVQTLRRRKLESSRRMDRFVERRNRAFSALRLLDTRLAWEVDPATRREMKQKRLRLTATMRTCQRIISRIRLAPTHHEIAEVMGVPKATVDSTIYRLKRRAMAFYAPDDEQSA